MKDQSENFKKGISSFESNFKYSFQHGSALERLIEDKVQIIFFFNLDYVHIFFSLPFMFNIPIEPILCVFPFVCFLKLDLKHSNNNNFIGCL